MMANLLFLLPKVQGNCFSVRFGVLSWLNLLEREKILIHDLGFLHIIFARPGLDPRTFSMFGCGLLIYYLFIVYHVLSGRKLTMINRLVLL